MSAAPDLAAALTALLASESHGRLRYAAGIDPHLTGRTCRLFAQLRRMASQGRVHAQRIAQLMEDLDIEPPPLAFGGQGASYHYVSVEALLPQLIAEKQDQVAAYRRALEHVADDAAARRQLQELLAATEAHGQELQTAAEQLAQAEAGHPA